MLNRRTPMKRTPFRRAAPTAESQPKPIGTSAGQALTAIKTRAPLRAGTYAASTATAAAIPKAAPVRSEALRRAVASLPCIACGIQGYSQAAHLPPEAKGMKQSDLLTFPLCCTRVGIPGCHQDYDQYRLFPREAAMTVGRAWAADTQRRIHAMGIWPKALPLQQFSTGDDFELTRKNRT